jgi:hypothetical protein
VGASKYGRVLTIYTMLLICSCIYIYIYVLNLLVGNNKILLSADKLLYLLSYKIIFTSILYFFYKIT